MFRLQSEPIRVEELTHETRGDGDGAVALFLGTVRDHNMGREVLQLEYHAYAEMAGAEMARIEAEARERFPVSRIAVVHRVGRLDVGETAVAVAVSSAHRAAAFDACRWIMDTVKVRLPLWKKEHFRGGETWIEPSGV